MNKQELIEFLKQNLKIKIESFPDYSKDDMVYNIYVSLVLEGDIISQETTYISIVR